MAQVIWINPSRFGAGAPDYSGLNIANHFTLNKTAQHVINYAMRIIQSSGDTTRFYVFFDGNNEISSNSPVSETTTPTGTTLGDKATAFAEWDVIALYDGLDGSIKAGSADQTDRGAAKIITSNTICTLNGKTAVQFQGTKGLYKGSGLTALDSASDCAISSVCSNEDSGPGVAAIVGNSTASATSNDSRIVQFHDRRTNKVTGILKNTSGTQYTGNFISQQNNNNQTRLTMVIDADTDLKVYFNTTIQETVSLGGSDVWVNDNFSIGSQRQDASALDGYWQETTVHDTNINDTQRTDLDNLRDDFYSF